jgi:hypothetical protein
MNQLGDRSDCCSGRCPVQHDASGRESRSRGTGTNVAPEPGPSSDAWKLAGMHTRLQSYAGHACGLCVHQATAARTSTTQEQKRADKGLRWLSQCSLNVHC